MNVQNTEQQGLQPRLSYLILVKPMLVAVDIGQAINDFVPRSKVIIVQCAEEADEALKSVENVHVAFLGLAPDSDKGWRLAEAIRARGGRMVFIGKEAEDRVPQPDGMVLEQPFNSVAVLAAIKGLPLARSGTGSRPVGMAYLSTGHDSAPIRLSET